MRAHFAFAFLLLFSIGIALEELTWAHSSWDERHYFLRYEGGLVDRGVAGAISRTLQEQTPGKLLHTSLDGPFDYKTALKKAEKRSSEPKRFHPPSIGEDTQRQINELVSKVTGRIVPENKAAKAPLRALKQLRQARQAQSGGAQEYEEDEPGPTAQGLEDPSQGAPRGPARRRPFEVTQTRPKPANVFDLTDSDIRLRFQTTYGSPCLRLTHGWWSYDICPGQDIHQLHINDGDESPDTIYSLGHYDWDLTQTRRYVYTDGSVGDSRGRPSPLDAKGKAAVLWIVQEYEDGQRCDETGEGRKSTLFFGCPTDGIGRVSYREPEVCRYEFYLLVPRLCEIEGLYAVWESEIRRFVGKDAITVKATGSAANARRQKAKR